MPVSALAGAALGERFDDLALGDCAVCATLECSFEFGLQQSQPLDARPHVGEMAAGAAAQASKAVQSEQQQQLLQLLELRRAGKTEEAKTLEQRLHRDYPQLDIEAQLRRLEDQR